MDTQDHTPAADPAADASSPSAATPSRCLTLCPPQQLTDSEVDAIALGAAKMGDCERRYSLLHDFTKAHQAKRSPKWLTAQLAKSEEIKEEKAAHLLQIRPLVGRLSKRTSADCGSSVTRSEWLAQQVSRHKHYLLMCPLARVGSVVRGDRSRPQGWGLATLHNLAGRSAA